MKNKGVILVLCIIGPMRADAEMLAYDPVKIGKRIWHNECEGTVSGLTSWNKGEDFASLGIGHFIWSPAKKNGTFKESFPALLAFIKVRGMDAPAWLISAAACPWNTRKEFLRDFDTERMKELRQFLRDTFGLQVAFMVERFKAALPLMLKRVSHEHKGLLKMQFNRLLQTTQGMYALVDYLNFKGEGLLQKEMYNGRGWGLLQVLEVMNVQSQDPVGEFVRAAKHVLAQRVQHSPAERNERRWLRGWHNRIDTYLENF